jgi:hypothetical protein
MNVYARLYESMLGYCDRSGFSCGVVYTVAMLALGLGIALNVLSGINLLWTLRFLHNPYSRGGSLRPEHYVYALVYVSFIANTILARVKFSADRRCLSQLPEKTTFSMESQDAPSVRTPGPAYVLGSVALFVLTLTVGLLTNR